MTIVLNGTTGITNDGGYTGDGVVFADTTPANTLVTTTGGNVGIGTSSPAQKLNVSGSGSIYGLITNTGTGPSNLYLGAANAQTQIISRDASTGAVPTVFIQGTTESARIDSSGNLLVGTSAAGNTRIWSRSATVSSSGTFALYCDNQSSTQLFSVRSDGAINTGVAGLSPYYLTTGTAANMVVGSDGFVYRSTSSLKYKKDVQDATHGLAEVMSLRPVTYKGKNDGDLVFGGLIAEEVHEAGLTEFVQYAEDGTPDALAYANMVSLAFKAIQEQQAIITALTARVAALEGTQP